MTRRQASPPSRIFARHWGKSSPSERKTGEKCASGAGARWTSDGSPVARFELRDLPMLPVRTMRPVYVDRLPPCNHACPAGENVQAWLAEAQAGRYRDAWSIIVRDNPMPAVHGRVCYHACEHACNRKDVDEAVSIHAVERFLE